MLASVKQFLDLLEQKNIRYCHWKSNEHLSAALDGDTDLDMLFDPAQRTELEQVFSACGIKRFRATPQMQYNAIEDFIGFDREAAKIWHIHTHYRLTLGEKHLKGYTVSPWGKILLENRVFNSHGVWTSCPSDELVLLLCRIALKLRWRDTFRRLGKDDQAELAWLLHHTDVNLTEKSAGRLVGERSASQIMRLIRKRPRRKRAFGKLQSALRAELRPFTSYNRFTSWFTRTKREFFWFFGGIKRRLGWSNYSPSRRISPAGGLVVAILGCDGAGKSTTLAYIEKEFRKKIDVVSVYLGSGDGSSSLLRRPMKRIAKKVGGKGVGQAVEREYAESKKISFKSRLYSLAKVLWASTLAREKKAKLRKLTRARNNGLLVLTDRYPQTVLPGVSDGPLLARYQGKKGLFGRIARREKRIYESFSKNPPDLTVKLVVPTEIAMERKPEMTAEEIERKKSVVMSLDLSENTAIIDTSRPFEITRTEVMEKIWELI